MRKALMKALLIGCVALLLLLFLSSQMPHGTIHGELLLGQNNEYKTQLKSYLVTALVVADQQNAVYFAVNNEISAPLKEGDSYVYLDGSTIKLLALDEDAVQFRLRWRKPLQFDIIDTAEEGTVREYTIHGKEVEIVTEKIHKKAGVALHIDGQAVMLGKGEQAQVGDLTIKILQIGQRNQEKLIVYGLK